MAWKDAALRELKQPVWLPDGCLMTGKACKKDTTFVRTNTDLTVLHHIPDSFLQATRSSVLAHWRGQILQSFLMRVEYARRKINNKYK